jgi:uncharacterized protein (TIGR03435 family)
MKAALSVMLVTAVLIGVAKAQTDTPLSFEVASVRKRVLDATVTHPSGSPIRGISGNQFRQDLATALSLIEDAYQVNEYQVIGLPGWAGSGKEIYEISAKTPGEDTPSQARVRLMLQTLLAERFQLRFHHETREVPTYALVVAKGGPKLTPIVRREGAEPGISMGMNAVLLALYAGRPVVDKTGLTGSYSFTPLDWAAMIQARDGAAAAPTLTSVFTEVEDKWGLKLEPQKGPSDVLVIDHIERPSEN